MCLGNCQNLKLQSLLFRLQRWRDGKWQKKMSPFKHFMLIRQFHVWFLMLKCSSVIVTLRTYFACRLQFTPFMSGNTYARMLCRKMMIWRMMSMCQSVDAKEQLKKNIVISDMKHVFICDTHVFCLKCISQLRIQEEYCHDSMLKQFKWLKQWVLIVVTSHISSKLPQNISQFE